MKDGVGLVLRADAVVVFNELRVRSATRGWTFDVYVADQPAATLGGWGEPIAHKTITSADERIALGDAGGGALLVWITDPGSTNQVRIAELDVQGRV